MENGSGVANLYPTLLNSNKYGDLSALPCLIRNGIAGQQVLVEMPGFPKLSNVELANIINYISVDLNQSSSEISINEVNKLVIDCGGLKRR